MNTILITFAIAIIAEIAGQIEPLANPESFLNRQLNRLLPWTIGMIVLSFMLFMGMVIFLLIHAGGRHFERERSFRQIKNALRSGAWRRDPAWRRFLAMMAGALLMACGLLSFFIVVGPPEAKLVVSAALLYATARTAWGFWRA